MIIHDCDIIECPPSYNQDWIIYDHKTDLMTYVIIKKLLSTNLLILPTNLLILLEQQCKVNFL